MICKNLLPMLCEKHLSYTVIGVTALGCPRPKLHKSSRQRGTLTPPPKTAEALSLTYSVFPLRCFLLDVQETMGYSHHCYTRKCTHTCTCTYTHTHIHTDNCTYICIFKCICIFTHMHTLNPAHTHISKLSSLESNLPSQTQRTGHSPLRNTHIPAHLLVMWLQRKDLPFLSLFLAYEITLTPTLLGSLSSFMS